MEEDSERIASKIEEKENKKSKKLIIILSSIAAFIVVCFLVVIFVIPKATAPKSVKVPSVKNMTVSKAEKTLQEKGFEVETKIKTVYDSDVKKGYVVKTDPESGRTIKQGSKITIYKSLGVKKYTLDDYVGKTYTEVSNELDSYGIKVSIEKVDPDNTNCKFIGQDMIIWQSLASGSKVKSGASISLKMLNSVNFPNFSGQTQNEVSNWANNNCVTLNVEYQETTDTAFIDKVINQSRPTGATVKNNDEITIKIGTKATIKEEEKPTKKPEYECVSKTDETDIKALNTDGTCPTGYDKKEKK